MIFKVTLTLWMVQYALTNISHCITVGTWQDPVIRVPLYMLLWHSLLSDCELSGHRATSTTITCTLSPWVPMVLIVGVACTVCSHVRGGMRNGPTGSILPDEQLIGIFAWCDANVWWKWLMKGFETQSWEALLFVVTDRSYYLLSVFMYVLCVGSTAQN